MSNAVNTLTASCMNSNNPNILNYSVTQGDAASSAGDITPL